MSIIILKIIFKLFFQINKMKPLLIVLLVMIASSKGASIAAHKGTLKLVWLPSNVPPPKHLSARQPFIEVPSSRQPKQFLGARFVFYFFFIRLPLELLPVLGPFHWWHIPHLVPPCFVALGWTLDLEFVSVFFLGNQYTFKIDIQSLSSLCFLDHKILT